MRIQVSRALFLLFLTLSIIGCEVRTQSKSSPCAADKNPWQQEEFKNGNVWKPIADHNPNLVVVLRGSDKYPVFDRCRVKKKNGKWEQMSYSGLGNPWNGIDRQHYRGSMPGKSYAGKNKRGGVRCIKGDDRWFFPLPGAPRKRWS